MEIPYIVLQASSSSTNLGKPRMSKDKTLWDLISITYTELLPRLLESQFIALSHAPPLKPPFPKWYNPNVRCDCHAGNLGHSMEDCNSLKYKVQTLIKVGKLNFESQDRWSNLSSNFFGTRIEEVKQKIPITENDPRVKEKEFAIVGRRAKSGRTRYAAKKIEKKRKY